MEATTIFQGITYQEVKKEKIVQHTAAYSFFRINHQIAYYNILVLFP